MFALLQRGLHTRDHAWSIGEMGAIAEFHHLATGQPSLVSEEYLCAVNALGAIKIALPAQARMLAYETPSADSRLWNHGIAVCLPEALCLTTQRRTITELGKDLLAVDSSGQDEVLFDLGLGLRTVEFCLRTGDLQLLQSLRVHCGRRWQDCPSLLEEIVKSSPTRVLTSPIGRIEVKSVIPEPYGLSPEGPHTHLLPKLLKHGRVFDANIPIAVGWLPCLYWYPVHPATNGEGKSRAFDQTVHRQFQDLLERFGDQDYLSGKRATDVPDGATRVWRLGALIGERQRRFSV